MTRSTPDRELPDTVLPVQFFTRTAFANSPERRLILAVVMDAVEQWRRGDPDAERWIRNEIEDPALGFADACEMLGLDAQAFADVLILSRIH